MDPSLNGCRPTRARISDVLPAPLVPTTATTEPVGMTALTCRSAHTFPKRTPTSSSRPASTREPSAFIRWPGPSGRHRPRR